MKTVDDKTFLLRDGVWLDTQYREGMKTVDVGFGGDDYFTLLAARPEWGKYFALGSKMIVLLDGVAYRVAEGEFPAITIPATHTPAVAATPSAATATAGLPGNPIARLWRWMMDLFRR